jgi:hypothetical protein
VLLLVDEETLTKHLAIFTTAVVDRFRVTKSTPRATEAR